MFVNYTLRHAKTTFLLPDKPCVGRSISEAAVWSLKKVSSLFESSCHAPWIYTMSYIFLRNFLIAEIIMVWKCRVLDIASMIFWTFGCFLDSGLWIGWSSNDHDLTLSDNKDPSQNTSFRPTYIVMSLQKVEILVIFRVPRLTTKNISDLISNPFWISKILCF